MATYDIIQFNGETVSYLKGQPYPPRPRWNGSNAAPAPAVKNDSGYDVTAPRYPQARREAAYQRASGIVSDDKFSWPMFIHDIKIDIALAGKTAQAKGTRDFYPHNFVQPSFQIQGQALDQEDYGNLCEFLHQAQHNAVNSTVLIQLLVIGFGVDGKRKSSRGVTDNKGNYFPNQVVRGSHKTILCQGYVGSMPREHQRYVVSPEYSFEFIVADMMLGPFSENMVLVNQQKTWVDILRDTQTYKPDLKDNARLLKNATDNSSNFMTVN